MASYTIRMPDIGEGITEVELVEWRVKEGDTVVVDQVLADVMTDKATVEIPSPVDGQVTVLGGKPGEVMAVGAELIRLEVQGAGNQRETRAPAKAAEAAAGAPAAPKAPASLPVPPAGEGRGEGAPPAKPTPPSATSPPLRTGRPLASPAVRQRALELGIELRFVHGSGPGSRITQQDLDVYLASRGRPAAGGGPARGAERHGEEQLPVIGLRRKIAQKMQEAKRRIPHFSYVEEIDVTALEALRAQLNARYASQRGKLTVLPLIARAMVLALPDFPMMNAVFDDDAGVVTRHAGVHLGIAAQTPGGLMVPVLRHAEAMDVWALGEGIARLAEAARTGKAAREELSGSTITLTSLGALGGIVTTPVINHPEVAIVGVNRIVERPVWRGGAVGPALLMNLSSSFDHRVVDGMDAAQFIQAVRALLETPAFLFTE